MFNAVDLEPIPPRAARWVVDATKSPPVASETCSALRPIPAPQAASSFEPNCH